MANIRAVKERGRKLPNVLNKKQLLQLFGCIELGSILLQSSVVVGGASGSYSTAALTILITNKNIIISNIRSFLTIYSYIYYFV